MPDIPITQQLLSQIPIIVVASSAAMFLLTRYRISTALLLLQYILLPPLLSERLPQSILFTRVGAGFSICLILYLTADQVQNVVRPITPESGPDDDGPEIDPEPGRPRSMGLPFCALTLALGAFTAYHLWRRYPLPPIPPELTLTSYWLMIGGVLVTLVSLSPLRIGFGLLSFLNGFVVLYLFWDPGFLVTALLNVIEVLFALGIVLFAEERLQTSVVDVEMEE
ncbi:MAG: hypothetical protein ACLFV5_04380 [Anaerolineales bacterium]